MRSQTACSECPPPAAHPFTTAMAIFGMKRMSRWHSRMCSRPARPASAGDTSVSPDAYW